MQTALMQRAFAGQALVTRISSQRPASRSAVAVRAAANAGNWLPGSDIPDYLDGLPGCYGFDPLGLGKSPQSLERFKEGEIINGRYAMLGWAGAVGAEVLGQGDWYSAPLWAVNGGNATYLGAPVPFNLETLLAFEFVAMAGAESLRGAEPEHEKRMYPGGAFDPAGLAKGDAQEAKTKELKNGRLAMLAFMGLVFQHAANGLSPLEALKSHLADPLNNNFATNGISLPF